MKFGVVIMLSDLPELNRAPTFSEIRSTASLCEDLGFDSIWVYDHFLYRFKEGETTGIWEGWSMLSALAALTRRVELGTLVTCNSFRNPALLAKIAHTVDEISGGRLTLGIGAGWNEPEHTAFGYPFDHRVSRLEEALQIIRPLLKEGRVDFEGRYYSARDCEITPRSPRPGGPPLMVGGGGPRIIHLAARYADVWNCGSMSIPSSPDGVIKIYREACQVEGRDPATLPTSFLVNLAFPDLAGWKEEKKSGFLIGSVEGIAAAFIEFEKRGPAQLMFHLTPSNNAAYGRLAKAVGIYRSAK
jgi:alkanesulfonate monooxygenase SsuD/methylene tetrahydromethanopterin reductase-like flavin-dependent oxidoreductase (luciferase family)